MKSAEELRIISQSPEKTHELGRRLGALIEKPMIIAMNGDLGSGKTAFIRGLARGLDVPGNFYITSPTYTIINEYPGRFRLFHVDLYRVNHPDELDEDTGFEEILGGEGVVAIEWAERLAGEDFSPDVNIEIRTTGPSERLFILKFYGPDIMNLVKGLKNIPTDKQARF